MKERLQELLAIGSLESFGEQEREAILRLFARRDLEEIEAALELSDKDSDLRSCLAYLAWGAISGRREERESRSQIVGQLKLLQQALNPRRSLEGFVP